MKQIYEMYSYSIQLKVLSFNFRNARISKFFFGRCRLPAVRYSTEGEDTGADNKSKARRCKTVEHSLTINPKLLVIGSSIMYLSSCSWGDGPLHVADIGVIVILAARNVNYRSTGVRSNRRSAGCS